MKQSRALTIPVVLALCALLMGGSFPALAQEGDPAAPVTEELPTDATNSPEGADAVQAALGTAFTYQGNLKKNGQPANTTCSLRFSLWDALTVGTQKGATQTINNVQVQAGMFTVQLNFGNQFPGDERWLQTAVQCAGDGGYTTLAPRQPLNAVPYAIGLRPGVVIQSAAAADAFYVEKTAANSVAIRGKATQAGGTGVLGESASWAGVWGQSTSASGVVGRSEGQFAGGVFGENTGQGYGVYGKARNGAGVVGESTAWFGVYGKSANQTGVVGESSGHDGIQGSTTAANRIGVKGVANASGAVGVWGESDANTGVFGNSGRGVGVWGQAGGASTVGVKGVANSAGAVGVWGESAGNTGVYGQAGTVGGAALWGNNTAGGVALRANGTAIQNADKGGLVKALVHVQRSGVIDRCYNGITGASANGCGFAVRHTTEGVYLVDFNFRVFDRFIQVTPKYGGTGDGSVVTMSARTYDNAVNTVGVHAVRITYSFADTSFWLTVY